ncbi:MAG: hypothetical protein OXL98_09310 [Acidimicrobiaceae bacterium]|nr:hypothetical protein [Acidimicrobiaceae bacterium]
MASDFETGFELKLGSLTGCVMLEDHPFHVETVAEARSAILRCAMEALGHHAHDQEKREHLRLNMPAGGPTWDDLADCEEGRRYDPADPDTGMTCSYLLYRQGGLEGIGGVMWTYGVTIWATAPPEVWDHPTDQPAGLDDDDYRGNDVGLDTESD